MMTAKLFEDAVQSATVESVHADYIITRNLKDFTKSKVMAFTPTVTRHSNNMHSATQNTENELLTHTISCVIMILRFVFVPVKQVKKFGFGEARKKNMRNMVPAFCEKLGHLE